MRTTVLAAALLAAGPLRAQTRIGALAEAVAAGVRAAPAGAGLAASAAPLRSPSFNAVSLNVSLAAPAALVQEQLSAAPAPLQEAGVNAILEALSPEKLARISGESSKTLSGRLLGLEDGVDEAPGAGSVSGRFSHLAAALDTSKQSAAVPARASAPSPYGPHPSVSDRLHHARLLAQNYYWYSVTHIVDMWPAYKRRWLEAKRAGAASVTSPRAFFAHMRVSGISGRFYVLGSAPLEDREVIARLRETFLSWYDASGAVGPAELAAFDAFTERARIYNSERRAPSNMRKHIRDALIKGSTIEPFQLAPFFDSLLVEDSARETADFQSNGMQQRVLGAFKKALLDTLAEEPADAKGRVRAAILLGSFASGSAGPRSDFDVELLTDGGGNARSAAFIKRLTSRWIATGLHASNPVTVHDFPSTPTRGIVDLVHTGEYLVFSLDSELAEKLQRRSGEYAPRMIRSDSLRGKVNRAVQFGVIVVSTYLGDLKTRFGSAPAGR